VWCSGCGYGARCHGNRETFHPGVSTGWVDSAFSLEPAKLKMLASESARVAAAWTCYVWCEFCRKKSLIFRRSLYVVQDVAAREFLTADNARAIRPGLRLPPKWLDTVL
jgi:N-acetylneuraminate synthase